MRREVRLTADAERDLEELYGYLAKVDSPNDAGYLLARILEVADSLAIDARRGSLPKELRSLGIQEYRQLFFKPYRVICRVIDDQVIIYVVADGRRDLQSLLARRLLGG